MTSKDGDQDEMYNGLLIINHGLEKYMVKRLGDATFSLW